MAARVIVYQFADVFPLEESSELPETTDNPRWLLGTAGRIIMRDLAHGTEVILHVARRFNPLRHPTITVECGPGDDVTRLADLVRVLKG